MTVKECSSARSQQQAAEDFLRSRLYGPGSRRTTCRTEPLNGFVLVSWLLEPLSVKCVFAYVFPGNEMLSIQNKKSRVKSAAVQFVKKDWGKSQCDAA